MAVALCLASAPAWACTPGSAKAGLVSSPGGATRATIRVQYGSPATVLVERRDGQVWRPTWSAPLLDGVAPGAAMLADDGRLLVFGNDDKHAIQLHDAQGRRVRELDLGDFLPAAYVRALPRGGHGPQWRRRATLARGQERVEFSVSVPGASLPTLAFSIDLGDGSVRTAQIREYLAAGDKARMLETATARVTSGRSGPAQLAGGGTPLPTPALSR